MPGVGIRAIEQNALRVVADAAAGEVTTITEHGRPGAEMTAVPASALDRLRASGRLRPARTSRRDLPPPVAVPPGRPTLSEVLEAMRDDERY